MTYYTFSVSPTNLDLENLLWSKKTKSKDSENLLWTVKLVTKFINLLHKKIISKNQKVFFMLYITDILFFIVYLYK